jgi:hypothetical protein
MMKLWIKDEFEKGSPLIARNYVVGEVKVAVL